jgi:hypothetical protein
VQAVFLLIGKTSALTMNIAGVIKDWMLIFFSFSLFHAPVTKLNLTGYAFCCSGGSAAPPACEHSSNTPRVANAAQQLPLLSRVLHEREQASECVLLLVQAWQFTTTTSCR